MELKNGKVETKSIKINSELHKRIKILCADDDISIVDFVEKALNDAIKKREGYSIDYTIGIKK